LPLSRQIQEIRHFEFTANPEGLNAILASQINNPWNVNRTLVVRQCIGEGECVESFRREVRTLIEQGMLNGKKDEYQFHLVVDQPSGILGSSSEYVRNFMREAERLRGKSMSANRKEETYVFRRDLLGSEVGLFSEWLDR
jgi:galactokinase/mevalonate kinase-like predicted kinase